jgi:hypothetical protein
MKGGEDGMSERYIKLTYPFIKDIELETYFYKAVLTDENKFKKTFLQDFSNDHIFGNAGFKKLFDDVPTGPFNQFEYRWKLKSKYTALEAFPEDFREFSSWPVYFQELWNTKYYTYKNDKARYKLFRENRRLKEEHEREEEEIRRQVQAENRRWKAANEERLRDLTLETAPRSLSEADFEILKRVNTYMIPYYTETVSGTPKGERIIEYKFNPIRQEEDAGESPVSCVITKSDIDELAKFGIQYNRRPKQRSYIFKPDEYKNKKLEWYTNTLSLLNTETTNDSSIKPSLDPIIKKLKCRQDILKKKPAGFFS